MQFSFYVSICSSCKDPLPTPSEFIVLQLLATVLKVIALNVYFISFHCYNLWSCVTPFSQTVFSQKFLSFVSISKKGFQMHYCAWKDLNTKCINITRIFFFFLFCFLWFPWCQYILETQMSRFWKTVVSTIFYYTLFRSIKKCSTFSVKKCW